MSRAEAAHVPMRPPAPFLAEPVCSSQRPRPLRRTQKVCEVAPDGSKTGRIGHQPAGGSTGRQAQSCPEVPLPSRRRAQRARRTQAPPHRAKKTSHAKLAGSSAVVQPCVSRRGGRGTELFLPYPI